MDSLFLCAALPIEVEALCRIWDIPTPTSDNPITTVDSKNPFTVKIAVSGIGLNRMEHLMNGLPPEPVFCWVSVGFAGALVPELKVGDHLSGSVVMRSNGEMILPCRADDFEFRDENRILLCNEDIVVKPGEKQTLHTRTGAVAVDLESAAVAQHARDRNEAFMWLRVISDSLEETLPRPLTRCFDAHGFPSVSAALRQLLLHPTLLSTALRLKKRTEFLSASLAEAVIQFVSFLKRSKAGLQTPHDSA